MLLFSQELLITERDRRKKQEGVNYYSTGQGVPEYLVSFITARLRLAIAYQHPTTRQHNRLYYNKVDNLLYVLLS